jgi:hypothetical protein
MRNRPRNRNLTVVLRLEERIITSSLSLSWPSLLRVPKKSSLTCGRENFWNFLDLREGVVLELHLLNPCQHSADTPPEDARGRREMAEWTPTAPGILVYII